MSLQEAKNRLDDTTFLLGWFRRRAAIRQLAESPDSSGVLTLAVALGNAHPNADGIAGALRQLSPERDPVKVKLLWAAWAKDRNPALAAVLARLGCHIVTRSA